MSQISSLPRCTPGGNLEKSLAKLGIADSDVDEMVSGWGSLDGRGLQAGSPPYGLAFGRFTAEEIAKAAEINKVKSTRIDHLLAYCVGPRNETCVALGDDSLAAFGRRHILSEIIAAQNGDVQGLSSNGRIGLCINHNAF